MRPAVRQRAPMVGRDLEGAPPVGGSRFRRSGWRVVAGRWVRVVVEGSGAEGLGWPDRERAHPTEDEWTACDRAQGTCRGPRVSRTVLPSRSGRARSERRATDRLGPPAVAPEPTGGDCHTAAGPGCRDGLGAGGASGHPTSWSPDRVANSSRGGDPCRGPAPRARALAGALGVSRVAVREAVGVLARRSVARTATGSGPTRGPSSTPAPADALAWLIELHVLLASVETGDVVRARIALERESARLAAAHALAPDWAAMRTPPGRHGGEQVTVAEFNEHDTAFHVAIARASGKPLGHRDDDRAAPGDAGTLLTGSAPRPTSRPPSGGSAASTTASTTPSAPETAPGPPTSSRRTSTTSTPTSPADRRSARTRPSPDSARAHSATPTPSPTQFQNAAMTIYRPMRVAPSAPGGPKLRRR